MVRVLLVHLPLLGRSGRDRLGRTALHVASGEGHAATVRILGSPVAEGVGGGGASKSKASPDSADYRGRSPVFAAAAKGQDAAIRVRKRGTNARLRCVEPTAHTSWKHGSFEFIRGWKTLLTRQECVPNPCVPCPPSPRPLSLLAMHARLIVNVNSGPGLGAQGRRQGR